MINIITIFWFLLNLNIAHIFYNINSLKAYRLTILTHYFVTIFSFFYMIPINFQAYEFIQIQICLYLGRISSMFTILILIFISMINKISCPLNNRKITLSRFLRNIYTHYLTTAILWYITPTYKLNKLDIIVNNIPSIIWTIYFYRYITEIYAVSGISTIQFITPIILASILYDYCILSYFIK